jgi:NAD(P)-dependent dehydrogenase (short-subunit alcohol dehydrogenase family)
MSRFEGKTVIVTGGGGGMGVDICKTFAAEGANVVVADVNLEAASQGIGALKAHGLSATPIALDVAGRENVEQVFGEVAQRFGGVDVLVCGAGVRRMSPLLDHSLEDWELTLRVNLTGVFLCSTVAARHMKRKHKGSIINIASVNGVRACEGMGAYNASKAGVISFTQTLACELGPHGIRVNAILPAQTETPMIAEQVGNERQRREERIPMGRYARPSEMASAIAFLASDDASFVTGHALAVDGGYLAFGFRPNVYG